MREKPRKPFSRSMVAVMLASLLIVASAHAARLTTAIYLQLITHAAPLAIVALGTPGGAESYPYGINSAGQIVGGADLVNGAVLAVPVPWYTVPWPWSRSGQPRSPTGRPTSARRPMMGADCHRV